MEGYVITIYKVDGADALTVEDPVQSRIKIFEQRVDTLDIHKFISALNVKPRKPRAPRVKS